MKRLVFAIILGCLLISSCARIREKKAEKHQPFKPHKAKKGQHHHSPGHQHHH